MVFVIESPASSDGGIEHEGHQYLCPSCSPRKFVDGDLPGALPQCLYACDRSVDFGLPQTRFRHDPCYRATMSGDDYGLPPLDVIEELVKVSLASEA